MAFLTSSREVALNYALRRNVFHLSERVPIRVSEIDLVFFLDHLSLISDGRGLFFIFFSLWPTSSTFLSVRCSRILGVLWWSNVALMVALLYRSDGVALFLNSPKKAQRTEKVKYYKPPPLLLSAKNFLKHLKKRGKSICRNPTESL